jgi:hypothetical protein
MPRTRLHNTEEEKKAAMSASNRRAYLKRKAKLRENQGADGLGVAHNAGVALRPPVITPNVRGTLDNG